MSQDNESMPADMAESASVAEAGEPQRLDEHGRPQAESVQDEAGSPTPQELDARNEAFSGPRKAMGPVDSGSPPESVPDEG